MEAEAFRELLGTYLIPMWAGTELGARRTSTARDAIVAYADPCTILMKPAKDLTYRLELVRSQPFSTEEKQLVTYFIDELAEIAAQSECSILPRSHGFFATASHQQTTTGQKRQKYARTGNTDV